MKLVVADLRERPGGLGGPGPHLLFKQKWSPQSRGKLFSRTIPILSWGLNERAPSLTWRFEFFIGLLGGLSNDDGDGNENGKKRRLVQSSKTTTLRLHHAFFTSFSRRCTTATENCTWTQDNQLLFIFLNLETVSPPEILTNME